MYRLRSFQDRKKANPEDEQPLFGILKKMTLGSILAAPFVAASLTYLLRDTITLKSNGSTSSENHHTLSSEGILQRLSRIQIYTWRYERGHILSLVMTYGLHGYFRIKNALLLGPMAQDIHHEFPEVSPNPRRLNVIVMLGLILLAIQEQYAKVLHLEQRLAQQEQLIEALERRLKAREMGGDNQ